VRAALDRAAVTELFEVVGAAEPPARAGAVPGYCPVVSAASHDPAECGDGLGI
jgi:hypothetical protein